LWADVSVLAAACHLPAIATGKIPAALGVIDELAALLLCGAQIGEQLPHRVIGQHRMQALKAS